MPGRARHERTQRAALACKPRELVEHPLLAGDHLPHHHGKRVHVGGGPHERVALFLARWRSLSRRPREQLLDTRIRDGASCAHGGDLPFDASDSAVAELGVLFAGSAHHQHVLGLDVAMHHPVSVERGDAIAHARDEPAEANRVEHASHGVRELRPGEPQVTLTLQAIGERDAQARE